jgi:hypothetical protein
VGLGGSQLGDFGEVLAFLLHRAAGRELVRVVSWRAGPGQVISGNRFPQPDFIVRESGRQSALEVKSTEAFDIKHLLAVNQRRYPKPCSGVSGCREDALEQLGYVGDNITPQEHSLCLQNGEVVPFPVDHGIAVAVLVHDGRTKFLRHDARFLSPKECREATTVRDCWRCVAEDHDAVVVTMRNKPGWLVVGHTHGAGEDWFRAYVRWRRAVLGHDFLAAEASSADLALAVTRWVERDRPAGEARLLRAFWGSYIGDIERRHGLEIGGRAGNTSLPTLADVEPDFHWRPEPISDHRVTMIYDEQFRAFASRPLGERERGWYTIHARLESPGERGFSVHIGDEGITFTLFSTLWWSRQTIEDDEQAGRIAAYLISLALDGPRSTAQMGPLPVRRVAARIGDRDVQLGWCLRSIQRPEDDTELWLWWLRWIHLFSPKSPPRWVNDLLAGDLRVRLRVFKDGHADLRVQNDVW